MARIQLEPLRGFRDILPPESERIRYAAEVFRRVAEAHGYREVVPPTLERFELFALKSGEEIRRSMFVFRDKAGREVALRPEVTASVARIYLRMLRGQPKPIRLYYVANCFRYEEPQRGRFREFYQAGVELIGEEEPYGDIEVAKLLLTYYRELRLLPHVRLKVGSVGLYRRLFAKHSVPEELQDHVLHLMDKQEYAAAADALRSRGFGGLAEKLEQLWGYPGSRAVTPEGIEELVSLLGEEAREPLEHLRTFIEALRYYDSSLQVDVRLDFARGLAYYTGVIFEVQVRGLPFSIAGGGRYDGLTAVYGGEPVPATGFAIGLDRTSIALEEMGIEVPSRAPTAAIAVLSTEPRVVAYALKLQDELARLGVRSTLHIKPKLGKLIPRLLEQGYRLLLVVGSREANEGRVTIKRLDTREQVTVELAALEEQLSAT